MVSNELLSKVLEIEVNDIDYSDYIKDTVYFTTHSRGINNEEDNISVYELAYKCKEWLKSLGLGYEITSIADHTWFALTDKTGKVYNHKSTISELEHVIAACEWALHNYKKESTSD